MRYTEHHGLDGIVTPDRLGHGDAIDERFSVEVGAVRYTERYGLDGVVTRQALAAARAEIAADLARIAGRPDRTLWSGWAAP